MADSIKQKALVRAAYAPDRPSAEQMIAVLEQFGIQARKQGGVKDIYRIGGDVMGEEIMVLPEDLDRAREILRQMTGDSSPEAKPSRSVRTTVLSLLGAAVLFAVVLALRGLLFGG